MLQANSFLIKFSSLMIKRGGASSPNDEKLLQITVQKFNHFVFMLITKERRLEIFFL